MQKKKQFEPEPGFFRELFGNLKSDDHKSLKHMSLLLGERGRIAALEIAYGWSIRIVSHTIIFLAWITASLAAPIWAACWLGIGQALPGKQGPMAVVADVLLATVIAVFCLGTLIRGGEWLVLRRLIRKEASPERVEEHLRESFDRFLLGAAKGFRNWICLFLVFTVVTIILKDVTNTIIHLVFIGVLTGICLTVMAFRKNWKQSLRSQTT